MIEHSIMLHTYYAYSAPILCGMHHIVFTLFYILIFIFNCTLFCILCQSAWCPPIHDAGSLCLLSRNKEASKHAYYAYNRTHYWITSYIMQISFSSLHFFPFFYISLSMYWHCILHICCTLFCIFCILYNILLCCITWCGYCFVKPDAYCFVKPKQNFGKC